MINESEAMELRRLLVKVHENLEDAKALGVSSEALEQLNKQARQLINEINGLLEERPKKVALRNRRRH